MELKESDKLLAEARKIVDRIQYRSITIDEYTTEGRNQYGSLITTNHRYRETLLDAIDKFLDSQSKDDLLAMSENAVIMVKYYTKLSAFDCIKETQNYEYWYNKNCEEIQALQAELKQAEEAGDGKVKEMQKTIDELYEQIGIAKGMYQECSKRIEQMIESAGMKP